MNLQKKLALTLALTTIGLTAMAAQAETIRRGTFTLPAQAYWNDTLLQPGDYMVSVDRRVGGVDLITVEGEGVNARFIAPAGAVDTSGRSFLKMDDLRGTYVIRAFEAGPIGKSYMFGVSKNVRNMNLRGEAGSPAILPVSGGM